MEDSEEKTYEVFEDDDTEEEDGVSCDETHPRFTDEKRRRRVSDVIDSIGDWEASSSDAGFATPRRHIDDQIDASSPDQGYSATPDSTRSLFVPDWSIKRSDISDATPSNALFSGHVVAGSVQNEIIATMPVAMDADRYNMNHKKRGKCVVFNHEFFDPGVKTREGSNVDAKRIQQTFQKLGFEVEILDSLVHAKVMDKITKLSEEDHSDCDCVCIFVLTHGKSDDLIYAKDAVYTVENIWKPFTGDRCKSLAGKPKLFFLQACRGEALDNGVTLTLSRRARHLNSELDSPSTSYKIPTHADILIAHSSAQGFYSWRNPTEGTWFVQCLCEVLDEYADTTDLLKMLTITARKISTERASYNDEASHHDKKQVPSITTMLLRDIYFTPK